MFNFVSEDFTIDSHLAWLPHFGLLLELIQFLGVGPIQLLEFVGNLWRQKVIVVEFVPLFILLDNIINLRQEFFHVVLCQHFILLYLQVQVYEVFNATNSLLVRLPAVGVGPSHSRAFLLIPVDALLILMFKSSHYVSCVLFVLIRPLVVLNRFRCVSLVKRLIFYTVSLQCFQVRV